MLSGSLDGHPGLESEAAHPGLQLTLVRTSGARLSSCVILQEPGFVAWLLSPLVLCLVVWNSQTFLFCKTLDSYLLSLSVAHSYWSMVQCHTVVRTLHLYF